MLMDRLASTCKVLISVSFIGSGRVDGFFLIPMGVGFQFSSS